MADESDHQDRLPTFKELKGYKRQRLKELYDEAASPPEGKSLPTGEGELLPG